MHEQSLVLALIEQVERHAPPGAVVRAVKVRAGPMRAIDPQLMQWAWKAGTRGTPLSSAKLMLTILPYEMTCLRCGRRWESEAIFKPCVCGSDQTTPGGDDALMLMALEIDELERATP